MSLIDGFPSVKVPWKDVGPAIIRCIDGGTFGEAARWMQTCEYVPLKVRRLKVIVESQASPAQQALMRLCVERFLAAPENSTNALYVQMIMRMADACKSSELVEQLRIKYSDYLQGYFQSRFLHFSVEQLQNFAATGKVSLEGVPFDALNARVLEIPQSLIDESREYLATKMQHLSVDFALRGVPTNWEFDPGESEAHAYCCWRDSGSGKALARVMSCGKGGVLKQRGLIPPIIAVSCPMMQQPLCETLDSMVCREGFLIPDGTDNLSVSVDSVGKLVLSRGLLNVLYYSSYTELRVFGQRLARHELQDPIAVIEWLSTYSSNKTGKAIVARYPEATKVVVDRLLEKGQPDDLSRVLHLLQMGFDHRQLTLEQIIGIRKNLAKDDSTTGLLCYLAGADWTGYNAQAPESSSGLLNAAFFLNLPGLLKVVEHLPGHRLRLKFRRGSLQMTQEIARVLARHEYPCGDAKLFEGFEKCVVDIDDYTLGWFLPDPIQGGLPLDVTEHTLGRWMVYRLSPDRLLQEVELALVRTDNAVAKFNKLLQELKRNSDLFRDVIRRVVSRLGPGVTEQLRIDQGKDWDWQKEAMQAVKDRDVSYLKWVIKVAPRSCITVHKVMDAAGSSSNRGLVWTCADQFPREQWPDNWKYIGIGKRKIKVADFYVYPRPQDDI